MATKMKAAKFKEPRRLGLHSAEALSLRSLCPEMCIICKTKDLKLKHSRQLQSKIITKTSAKTPKYAAFARYDKEMIIVVSDFKNTRNVT